MHDILDYYPVGNLVDTVFGHSRRRDDLTILGCNDSCPHEGETLADQAQSTLECLGVWV